MDKHKLQLIGVGIVIFVVGTIIGSLCSRHAYWKYGSRMGMMPFEKGAGAPYMMKAGMHQMPDGSVMMNSGGMQGMMHDMTTGLAGKKEDPFDKAFLDEMIVHHQGAVDMAKMVLTSSERAEMKDFAQDIIDMQTAEIEMMQEWRSGWFAE